MTNTKNIISKAIIANSDFNNRSVKDEQIVGHAIEYRKHMRALRDALYTSYKDAHEQGSFEKVNMNKCFESLQGLYTLLDMHKLTRFNKADIAFLAAFSVSQGIIKSLEYQALEATKTSANKSWKACFLKNGLKKRGITQEYVLAKYQALEEATKALSDYAANNAGALVSRPTVTPINKFTLAMEQILAARLVNFSLLSIEEIESLETAHRETRATTQRENRQEESATKREENSAKNATYTAIKAAEKVQEKHEKIPHTLSANKGA